MYCIGFKFYVNDVCWLSSVFIEKLSVQSLLPRGPRGNVITFPSSLLVYNLYGVLELSFRLVRRL